MYVYQNKLPIYDSMDIFGTLFCIITAIPALCEDPCATFNGVSALMKNN